MICKASPILDYFHPIIIRVTFSFPKIVSDQHVKNHLILSIHLWDRADIRVPRQEKPHPIKTQKRCHKIRINIIKI